MANILLVEDNSGISEGLAFSFSQTSHRLTIAQNVKEAKAAAERGGLSLVLLDVSLPDGDGFSLYRDCFGPKKLPVIFLTARDEEEDIVRGLELGAEDYITKPFSAKELMARVNKVLRRSDSARIIRCGDIVYNLDNMEVKRGDEIIKLSSLELKLLNLFMENKNHVVSRDAVIDLIWETTGNDVYDHTVTVYIKRLREKLGEDIITTVKGIGYRVDESI